MKQHKRDHTFPHSIVFYDHACGFCRHEMSKLKKRDHLERLYLVDVSSPQFEANLWGVSSSAVQEQLHVRTPAGDWLIGIPVFDMFMLRSAWGGYGGQPNCLSLVIPANVYTTGLLATAS